MASRATSTSSRTNPVMPNISALRVGLTTEPVAPKTPAKAGGSVATFAADALECRPRPGGDGPNCIAKIPKSAKSAPPKGWTVGKVVMTIAITGVGLALTVVAAIGLATIPGGVLF